MVDATTIRKEQKDEASYYQITEAAGGQHQLNINAGVKFPFPSDVYNLTTDQCDPRLRFPDVEPPQYDTTQYLSDAEYHQELMCRQYAVMHHGENDFLDNKCHDMDD